jgi:hypothetical protein
MGFDARRTGGDLREAHLCAVLDPRHPEELEGR